MKEIKSWVRWCAICATVDVIAIWVFHAPGWAAFLGSTTIAFIVVQSKDA